MIAQSPDSAAFDGNRPERTETGVVDRILTPEEMPDALERLKNGKLGDPRRKFSTDGEPGLMLIMRLLRGVHGLDFTVHKPSTILRRTRATRRAGARRNTGRFRDAAGQESRRAGSRSTKIC